MMDFVLGHYEAAIGAPPGTTRKFVQVALQPDPSKTLATTFIQTHWALAALSGRSREYIKSKFKLLMASCVALIH